MKHSYRTGRLIRGKGLAFLLSFLVGGYFFSSQLLPSRHAAAREPSVEEQLVAVYPGLAKRLSAGTEFAAASRTVDGNQVEGWTTATASLSKTKAKANKKRQAISSFFPAFYNGPFMADGDNLLIKSTSATGEEA